MRGDFPVPQSPKTQSGTGILPVTSKPKSTNHATPVRVQIAPTALRSKPVAQDTIPALTAPANRSRVPPLISQNAPSQPAVHTSHFSLPRQPAAGSGLLSESQLSLRAEHAYPLSQHAPSEQASRRLWTAVSHHSSPCVRSTPTRLHRTSQPQALDCSEPSQLSLRAEHACQPPPNTPLRTSSRRLWTAVSHHSSL